MTLRKQLSAVAVAVLGAFASGSASAAIQLATTGNSNLVFSAWDDRGTADTTDDSGYVRDLGLLMNDLATATLSTNASNGPTFQAGASQKVIDALSGLSTDAAFTTWFNGTNKSTVQWNVVGADTTGTGGRRLITTLDSLEAPASFAANNAFTTITNRFDTFFADVNTLGTHASQPNGSAVINFTENPNQYPGGQRWGSNFAGSASFDNAAGLDAPMTFWLLTNAGSSNLTEVRSLQFMVNPPLVLKLSSDGVLSAAPIPEPSTYALMGLGLAGIAVVARRRAKR